MFYIFKNIITITNPISQLKIVFRLIRENINMFNSAQSPMAESGYPDNLVIEEFLGNIGKTEEFSLYINPWRRNFPLFVDPNNTTLYVLMSFLM